MRRQQRTGTAIAQLIERELIPHWGTRHIADITDLDVIALVKAVKLRGSKKAGQRRRSSGGPHAAHKVLAHIRWLFKWAKAQRIYGLKTSPCTDIETKEIIGERRPRKRVLKNEEVVFVWRAAERMGYPFGPLVQLLLLLAVRLNDAARASWDEIELDPVASEDGDSGPLWTIPPERMKMDAAHEIPLPPFGLEIIRSLPRFRGKYLFTTTDGTVPVSGFSKMKARLDGMIEEMRKEAGLEPMAPWVLHDLRRTARTGFGNLGEPHLVCELLLAHKQGGLHEVYDQGRYRHQKRHALERWAQSLSTTINGKPGGNVEDFVPRRKTGN